MKNIRSTRHRILPALLAVVILCASFIPTVSLSVLAAEPRAVVTTTPTGYTKASDVVYKPFTQGKYSGVMNWGARGEDCIFLSTNAEDYYVGSYTYATLSVLDGGTQSTAPSSELYSALKEMMVAEHSHIITYQNTRDLYAYTDCVSNQSGELVSFYSGVLHSSKWDAGATWNREHVWPNSKCIGDKTQDAADIMMLRPTLTKENGSRGNKAYGESGTYFDPGESVRGDCARILLYQYTRWGNTGRMWGSSGVIENVDVLLRWMEEDPVDTWEMGRNDAVESITGVRNVFVDYPEYAFLLFNRAIPADMVTPSGMATAGDPTPGTPETLPPSGGTETEPEFEMTQPEPPPTTEPDFEMTQPEPPPTTEPDFEMTQPEPPPALESTQQTGSAPESESDATTDSPLEGGRGCGLVIGGDVVLFCMIPSSFALLLTLSKRRRED